MSGAVLAPTPTRTPLDWQLLAGLVLLALVLLPAIVALGWTPHATAGAALLEPGPAHWLGTDATGRDLVSALMTGALASLSVAGFATLICLMLGLPSGTLIALRTEFELPDVPVLGIPVVALAIALVVSGLGAPAILTVILAVGLPGVPAAALLAANALRPLWRLDFVVSARLAGLSPMLTAQRHVLPRLLPGIAAIIADLLAAALLVDVMLAFAGLASVPPGNSLGRLLAEGQEFLAIRPLLVIAPGLTAVAAALGLTIVAARCRNGAG